MNKLKKAFVLNILLFICVLFAILWMMSGIRFAGTASTLPAARWGMLRYFTVDSNILMGIAALAAAIDQGLVLKGKKNDVSLWTRVLKFTGTVSVTLTMLVTVFFLTPTMAPMYGWFANFSNSNFLLHLLNPVLAIVSFVLYEKTNAIRFHHTFIAIVPMVIYACYYVQQTLTHLDGGRILPGYDWYGFFVLGIASGVVIVPLLVAITWGIAVVERKLNMKGAEN